MMTRRQAFMEHLSPNVEDMHDKKFALVIMQDNRIGVGFECIRPGDAVVVLRGAQDPVILRPEISQKPSDSGYVTSEKSYRFLGTCTITGDSISNAAWDELPWMNINLV